MAKIIQQSWPNKVTYIIDIDEKILKKGTFNYLALASDQARVARCSLFQDLLKRTTPQHNQAHAIHSFKMENTAQGGTRFTMTSQPYAFTQAQVDQMIAVIHQRAHEANLSRFPLIDEDGLSRDEMARQQEEGEFNPDRALQTSDPQKFAGQVALLFAFRQILPGIREHKGNLTYKDLKLDPQKKTMDFSVVAKGSCMGCSSASITTIKTLHKALSKCFQMPNVQSRIGEYTVGDIKVYDAQAPKDLAYSVNERGVFSAQGSVIRIFEQKPALN